MTAHDDSANGDPPLIFLTEQGPVYSHETTPRKDYPLLTEDQATLMMYAYMNEAAQLSPRIRLYAHYQMQGTPWPGWDSGFRSPTANGEPVRTGPYNAYRDGRPNVP